MLSDKFRTLIGSHNFETERHEQKYVVKSFSQNRDVKIKQ